MEETTAARQAMPAQQIFKQETFGHIHAGMNPNGLTVRESRDIPGEHDKSVAVIFGMDITGSMQDIPQILATRTLRDFMPGFARIDPDTQVLFTAFGDPFDGGEAPWQIGQFESDDAKADEWLTRMWLGGSGGGAPYEAYDLVFYFAAYHTSIDCWEKRRKKGYLFITGDDICRSEVAATWVNRLLGRMELAADIPIQTVIAKAAEMYHIFFLIPDLQREKNWRDGQFVGDHWRKLLGENGTTVVLEHPDDEAVASAILFGITEGAYKSLSAIRESLRSDFKRGPVEVERVIRAITPYAQKMGLAER